METWFKAEDSKIEKIEIAGSTDKFIVKQFNGSRELKTTSYHWWAKTREEAKALMVAQYHAKANQYERLLKYYQERLQKAMEA